MDASEFDEGDHKRPHLLLILILTILFCAFDNGLASGDGSHSDAASITGGVSRLTYRGFKLELLTSSNTLRAGEKNKFILKVLLDGTMEPIRDGIILMAVVPMKQDRAGTDTVQQNGEEAPKFSRAFEDIWAGNYTIEYAPERAGLHRVKIVLVELRDLRFDPPDVLEFHVNIANSAGWISFFPWLLAAGIALGGIAWASARSRSTQPLAQPFNLLKLAWLNRFIRWRGFPIVFQIPMLLVTGLIAILGILDSSEGAKNLATRLTWIVWWPGIILTFVFFGRIWCIVCPFGTLNEGAARLAQPDRILPKVFRGIWVSTILFLLLTWADEQLGIVRSPQMTASLIIVLALLAVGTGLFFQRRSFCRYVCPITGLQGLYSMMSPIELRTGDRSLCHRACRQDCYRGNANGVGCPMFEFPATLKRNTYCNFCFECVKSCPGSNMVFSFRRFGKDLWTSTHHSGETYLALVLVGVTTVVTAQMLPGWADAISGLSKWLPLSVRVFLKPVTYLTLVETFVFFSASLAVFPVLGFLAAWISSRLITPGEHKTKEFWRGLGYMFIPVGVTMHLAHNLSHILLEGGSIVPSLQHAMNRFTPFYLGEPAWNLSTVIAPDVVGWLQAVVVLGGLVFSIVVGYRLAAKIFAKEVFWKALIPFIVFSLLLTVLNLYILAQPMGPRHAM